MTDDILKEISSLAALSYTPAQVGVATGIEDTDILMLDENSAFYKAYTKGYLETDIQFRNSVRKLALAGSSPAQNLWNSITQQTERRKTYE